DRAIDDAHGVPLALVWTCHLTGQRRIVGAAGPSTQVFDTTSFPADANRVCRLNVAPRTSTCTVRPSRHTGSPSSTWSIDENCSREASTTVTPPLPSTSSVLS